MEPQSRRLDTVSLHGSLPGNRLQTARVLKRFKGLQQKVDNLLVLVRRTKPYRNVLPVTLFVRYLKNEYLAFRGTLDGLTDAEHDETKGVDWMVVEETIERRCVSEYARYSDFVSRILLELDAITELLGFNEDVQITDIVSSNDRWGRLLQALYTLDGSGGATLQVSFANIQQANEELVQIQRQSLKDPSTNFFESLLMLRDRVASASDILGPENGFHCQCPEPHQVFLRAKDCFKLDKGFEPTSEPWDQACSLLFQNLNSVQNQWRQVEMQFSTSNVEMSKKLEPTHQQLSNETASKTTSSNIADDTTKKTKKKAWKSISGLLPIFLKPNSVHANSSNQVAGPAPTQVPLPPMTTNPSDGLCAFLNNGTGTGEEGQGYITMYREKASHKLVLTPADGMTQLDVRWADPLPILAQSEDPQLELSTEQRLQLAHQVAFSLFYLFSTPWIQESWTSDDVYLTWQESPVAFVHPVFSRKSIVVSNDALDIEKPSQPKVPFVNSLGRFLVELWCGTSWSHLQRVFLAGEGSSEVMEHDTFIFNRLLNWIGDSKIADRDKPFHLEGSSYLMAVRKCFTCDFNLSEVDKDSLLGNEHFARWIYRHVLRPLQYSLEDFQSQQERFFGTRLDFSPQVTAPRAGEDTKRLRLFANEDIENRQKKEKTADKWFYEYGKVKDFVRSIGRERPENPADRVRVAILDTGVDVTHDDLHSPWLDGQIFYQNFVGKRSGIPQDDDGHGTHVTSILLQMAENVDVYVARVSRDGLDWKSKDVEDAIRWAITDKQVHILSLSFGFPNADQSLEGIQKALLEAHASDVLIFAATGNRGDGNAVAFPACLDEVISVASIDGDNHLSSFVPDLRVGKRLCAIGEAIEAAWINKDVSKVAMHSTTERKAGTSYATPVVAGVAAMIMDLVWSAKHIFNDYNCKTLRTNHGMLAVLELIIYPKDKIKCLMPRQFFDKRVWKSYSG
ncbi:uncharacterized protein LY89DRAFT_789435 [Mollisia scopiformis]|uniref:Uncharacterized protein n=1 Tax=Mollisia scopiformis TaxID=149040 RepID=A0A132B5Q7_MOLSC|nr:uncharacterized protein LY89DRAFT_789435 [Mollisia scopiformis]KUJ07746.1 hypothetical protein LY89DRAFT_789435 [Mollisia scopiformis]